MTTTSSNNYAVNTLAFPVSDKPTQPEVQTIRAKLTELISVLRR